MAFKQALKRCGAASGGCECDRRGAHDDHMWAVSRLRRMPRRNWWGYKEVHWPEEWEWERCGLGGWLVTDGRAKWDYSAPMT